MNTMNLPVMSPRVLLPVVSLFGALSLRAAPLLELTPSSYGRIQDNVTLGSNTGTSDSLNTSPSFLYLGDHANNASVFHVGYKFSLEGAWSFVGEETRFLLTITINEVQNGGWDSVTLYHVPTHAATEVSTSLILGGTVVSSIDTSGAVASGTLVFDVTDFLVDDLLNDRSHATFRLSQTTLFNNGDGLRNAFVLGAEPTLAAIPEPPGLLLSGMAGMAFLLLLRRRSGHRQPTARC